MKFSIRKKLKYIILSTLIIVQLLYPVKYTVCIPPIKNIHDGETNKA